MNVGSDISTLYGTLVAPNNNPPTHSRAPAVVEPHPGEH